MLLKHRAKMDAASTVMEESKARMEAEEQARKSNEIRVDEMLSWAERYDDADCEARHLIISALVERIEVRRDNQVDIFFRMTAEQFLGPVAVSA